MYSLSLSLSLSEVQRVIVVEKHVPFYIETHSDHSSQIYMLFKIDKIALK